MAHLTFINDDDFTKAEFLRQGNDGHVYYEHEGTGGVIRKNFIRPYQHQTGTQTVIVGKDEDGKNITEEQPVFEPRTKNIWERLKELDTEGTISVEWLTQADKDAIQTQQDAAIAKQQERQAKLSAFEFKGVTCSVCESDQNGWETLNSKIQRELSVGTPWQNIPFFMENGNHVVIESAEEWQAFIDAGWDARQTIMMARLA